MSHNIKYYTYEDSKDFNRRMVEAEINDFVRYETYGEGGHGLNPPIDWDYNKICDSYEDAEAYLKSKDNGWHYSGAVRYCLPPEELSKRCASLRDKNQSLAAKFYEETSAIHYKNVHSAFISCKNCGSKIASKYIHSNFCPVCSADMRPASTLERIKKLKQRVKEAQAKYEKALAAEAKKSGKYCWLVKIEYHT